jgi:NADPH:quinone reductase-like Zn-dependent oxidoreductase
VRAALFDRYGGPEVVRITEVPRPEPGRNDVLVQVRAAAVTSADARIRGARFPRGFGAPARLAFGVRRPRRRVLGSAFSGLVAAVGPAVEALTVGDEVAGMAGMRMGAHAELLVVPAARAVRKPAAVSHEDAAGVIFGGTTALHYLREKATVGPGTTVLVTSRGRASGGSRLRQIPVWLRCEADRKHPASSYASTDPANEEAPCSAALSWPPPSPLPSGHQATPSPRTPRRRR